MPFVARRSSHAASYPEAPITGIASTATADRAAQKEGQPQTRSEQWLASTTTAGTRRASRRPRPPARRRRRPPGRTRPGAPAATWSNVWYDTVRSNNSDGSSRLVLAAPEPAQRRAATAARAAAARAAADARTTSAAAGARRRRGRLHQRPTRRPAPTSKTGGPRRPGRRRRYMCKTNLQERRTAFKSARGPRCNTKHQHRLIPMPTWPTSFRSRGTTASRTLKGCWYGASGG